MRIPKKSTPNFGKPPEIAPRDVVKVGLLRQHVLQQARLIHTLGQVDTRHEGAKNEDGLMIGIGKELQAEKNMQKQQWPIASHKYRLFHIYIYIYIQVRH